MCIYTYIYIYIRLQSSTYIISGTSVQSWTWYGPNLAAQPSQAATSPGCWIGLSLSMNTRPLKWMCSFGKQGKVYDCPVDGMG